MKARSLNETKYRSGAEARLAWSKYLGRNVSVQEAAAYSERVTKYMSILLSIERRMR